MPRIHHVQLAMPAGEEERARGFFGAVLGMEEVAKPPVLAERGGVWFRHGDLELHLGVEEPFVPARKAHPGILTGELDAFAERLRGAGYEVDADPRFPGHRRFYTHDCFGNRLEFLERVQADLPRLVTDRVTLRQFQLGDVDDVLAYADDEELARFVPGVPRPYTLDDARDFVRRSIASDHDTCPVFAIERDGHVIGGCNLDIDREADTAELGYAVGRESRGRGIATEIACRLVQHAFEDLDVAVVWARADAENGASHRVLEKVGMTHEGTLRGRVVRHGERRDERFFSILRSEWEKRT